MKRFYSLTGALSVLFFLTFSANLFAETKVVPATETGSPSTNSPALKNAVVLIIRHAEKPESGDTLNAEGEARAKAYVEYFKNFTVDSKPIHLDYLFAATDSKGSHRPRLTIEPLSQSIGLKIDTRFTDKKPEGIVHELQSTPHGTNILISWRHGKIPELLTQFGAAPEKLIPSGEWPGEVFNWVIQLRYDENGHLKESKCINEKLMPGDAALEVLTAK